MFEISVRMHANNHKIVNDADTLETIIDKLPTIFPLTQEETKLVHGREKISQQGQAS